MKLARLTLNAANINSALKKIVYSYTSLSVFEPKMGER